MLGWSVLEGIGAALVLPAMVALVASNFRGQERALAYGVLGGVAGAGIAVGPILGGWATTELSWRVVFAGEVVVVVGILARHAADSGAGAVRTASRASTGSAGVLSATGLGVMVLGVLQAEQLGLAAAAQLPDRAFGLSLISFVIAAGALISRLPGLGAAARASTARSRSSISACSRSRGCAAALSMLLSQNLVLMGVFFTVPLFLQIVQGLDALETGVRMLPASVGLFVTALAGAALAKRFPRQDPGPRRARRRPGRRPAAARHDRARARQRRLPGRDGRARRRDGPDRLPARQRRPPRSRTSDRSEAGGLQNTAQQLGSSLGTALLGAIVISGLISAFTANVAENPRISDDGRAGGRASGSSAGASFVAADQVRSAAESEGLDPRTTDELVGDYEDAQLDAPQDRLPGRALLVVASFFATSRLPTRRFDELQAERGPPAAGPRPEPSPAPSSGAWFCRARPCAGAPTRG